MNPSHTADMVRLRHALHEIPELGYQEFKTAAAIRAELDRLGIAHHDGVDGAPTATVAVVGDSSKPCIALRADIDALPITERTGLAYASKHTGMMHACGHDGHSATLVGAAATCQARARDLSVCVKFLWQPAEEGGAGAQRLIAGGVLDGRLGPKVEAIFGLHGWPGLKVGTVATRAGALLAATDNFSAQFIGQGTHAAYPHLGRDPIMAAAQAVVNLQQIVSREFDPTDAAVVSVGLIQGGTAVNIMPHTATIEGTARTLSEAARQQMAAAVERRCRGIAAAGACDVKFAWHRGYPPTVNDAAMADYVARTAQVALGPQRFVPVARASMGGEDFAYYLEKVPGCFFLIGVEPWATQGYPSLHTDQYDFTDAAMETGVKMFVQLAAGWAGR